VKKTKIFLDTTVISFLYNPQRPEWERETWALWDYLIIGKYDIVLSNEVIREVNACPEPKKEKMNQMLNKIDFTIITINEAIEEIANEIIRLGFLKEKNRVDCLHISSAIFSHCKYLVSWNYEDLANTKTNDGVRSITHSLHYPSIDIILPYNLKFREDQ
jgi:predicted nucleic acid-binding protein